VLGPKEAHIFSRALQTSSFAQLFLYRPFPETGVTKVSFTSDRLAEMKKPLEVEALCRLAALYQQQRRTAPVDVMRQSCWGHVFVLQLIGCITAAFLHRRHLMVWQIFASRFLYESLSFLVVCVTSALTYIYLGRVERSLQLWITKRVEQNWIFARKPRKSCCGAVGMLTGLACQSPR